jgi:hypothetical protein
MTPNSKRPTRQEIKERRPAQRAADRLSREADRMQQRSDALGAEIEQARSGWQRKRADQTVPGANPPHSEKGLPDEAAYTTRGGQEDDGLEAGSEDAKGS